MYILHGVCVALTQEQLEACIAAMPVAMQQLDPIEREIIKLYYGIDSPEMTSPKIAAAGPDNKGREDGDDREFRKKRRMGEGVCNTPARPSTGSPESLEEMRKCRILM